MLIICGKKWHSSCIIVGAVQSVSSGSGLPRSQRITYSSPRSPWLSRCTTWLFSISPGTWITCSSRRISRGVKCGISVHWSCDTIEESYTDRTSSVGTHRSSTCLIASTVLAPKPDGRGSGSPWQRRDWWTSTVSSEHRRIWWIPSKVPPSLAHSSASQSPTSCFSPSLQGTLPCTYCTNTLLALSSSSCPPHTCRRAGLISLFEQPSTPDTGSTGIRSNRIVGECSSSLWYQESHRCMK